MQPIFLDNKIQKYPRKTWKKHPKIFHLCWPNNILKFTRIRFEKVVWQWLQFCWWHRYVIAYILSQNPPSGNLLKPWFEFSTKRCIFLHYSPTAVVLKLASNDVNVDDVTITTLRFRGKQLIYFDPDNVKDEYFASFKPLQGDFYVDILDSNVFIFFKFDTVVNIRAKSELWK